MAAPTSTALFLVNVQFSNIAKLPNFPSESPPAAVNKVDSYSQTNAVHSM